MSVWMGVCCPAGGITAYQSHPWGNLYSQSAVYQQTQCPSSLPASKGASREPQPPSSTYLHFPPFYPQGDLAVSQEHSPLSAHAQPSTTINSTTSTSTSTTTILPPVSTLRPSHLRGESASLSPSQVSPASPESPPVPPCVKIEYESPQEIQSHFHCDFSPTHFWSVCVSFKYLASFFQSVSGREMCFITYIGLCETSSLWPEEFCVMSKFYNLI